MPRANQRAWRSNTARPRDWSENTRAGIDLIHPVELFPWQCGASHTHTHHKLLLITTLLLGVYFVCKLVKLSPSERRRGRKEKPIWGQKWRRERGCTKRQSKDCKSRWEDTSNVWTDLLDCACHFSVVIVPHCSSQIAQLEGKAPQRQNHSVDSPYTGKS